MTQRLTMIDVYSPGVEDSVTRFRAENGWFEIERDDTVTRVFQRRGVETLLVGLIPLTFAARFYYDER